MVYPHPTHSILPPDMTPPWGSLCDFMILTGYGYPSMPGPGLHSLIEAYEPPFELKPKPVTMWCASITILDRFMPDTVTYAWDRFQRYCMNDVKTINLIRDVAINRIEFIPYWWVPPPIMTPAYQQAILYALGYNRLFHDAPIPPAYVNEPHWFKHDRKAYR